MTPSLYEPILQALAASLKDWRDLLAPLVPDQNWRPAPDQWSIREVGAHLALAERACFLARVRAIASGGKPRFDNYENTPDQLAGTSLEAALAAWTAARQEMIAFVRGLPEACARFTGTHAVYGAMTIHDYLRLARDHDAEHRAALETALQAHRPGK